MRIRGMVLKKLLHIFIDSGSTHNFLDLYTAKKLGCDIKSTCPLQVSVASDNKLISQNKVSAFQWVIQGTIQWNFQDLKMQFNYKERKVCLRYTSQSELSWMHGKQLNKLLGLVYLESYIIYHESLERIVEDDKYLNFKCY
ncbi:putative mitochondrial protein [Tanacetum coccineum]